MDILFPTGKKTESSEPEVVKPSSSSLLLLFFLLKSYVGNAATTECNLLICLWIFFASCQNKSETKKVVAPLPAVTPEEIGEGYKDLEESIKGFIKELDEAAKETEATSQPETPPSSVEDES